MNEMHEVQFIVTVQHYGDDSTPNPSESDVMSGIREKLQTEGFDLGAITVERQ